MSRYDFSDTNEQRRETMRVIGSEDTGPERKAEAALDELGVVYDKQVQLGRYRPDFLLEDGSVLQIMGCFWHCCPCKRGMDGVEDNADYWTEKHAMNHERDHRRRRELLHDYDVTYVFWIWEHEDVAARVYDYCCSRGMA